MLWWIGYIAAGYFALVGLVQTCLVLGRWFQGAPGEGRWLVLTARGDDPAMEMKIRGARAQAGGSRWLKGAAVVVVNYGASAETLEVCRRLCADLGIPLLEPEEFSRLLAEE